MSSSHGCLMVDFSFYMRLPCHLAETLLLISNLHISNITENRLLVNNPPCCCPLFFTLERPIYTMSWKGCLGLSMPSQTHSFDRRSSILPFAIYCSLIPSGICRLTTIIR